MTLPSTLPCGGDTCNLNNGNQDSGAKHLFMASDGDLFLLGTTRHTVPSTSATEVTLWRSTDGGNTWNTGVETDREGEGPPSEDNIAAVSADQDGDTLYVAWMSSPRSPGMAILLDIEYQVFDLDANTWSGSFETVNTFEIDALNQGNSHTLDVARRTSDTVIIAQTDHANVMGNAYFRTAYHRGNVGSWTGPVDITAGGEIHYRTGGVNVGSQAGECHLFHRPDVTMRTLRADNTMSTAVDMGENGASSPAAFEVFQDSGGTWVIGTMVAFGLNELRYHRFTEDGSNDAQTDAVSLVEDLTGNSPVGVNLPLALSFAEDADVDDLYAFWSPRDDDDMDYEFKADGASGAWTGTVTESWQTGSFQSAKINSASYTHSSGNGGATVIGVAWVTGVGGDMKYDEIVVSGGPVGGAIPYRRRQSPHVRM